MFRKDRNLLHRSMIVFHSAYSFRQIKSQGLEIFVSARDATNFFDSVLTVSPVASLQYETSDPARFSPPELFTMDSKNIILEGRVGRFKVLEKFKIINFIFSQIELFYSIQKSINLRGVKLIRSEDPRLNGIYGYLLSRLIRKPLIVGLWGNPGRIRRLSGNPTLPGLFRTSKIEAIVERFILRKADLVLAQNRENLSYAFDCGVDISKTKLTPLGVGIDKAHFLTKTQRAKLDVDLPVYENNGTLTLCCISRLEKLKNVDHAILAASVIQKAGLNFKLFLIGDGREREKLRELADCLGLTRNVIFLGNKSQEWIAGFLTRVDLNIAPLCGRSLLEASLSGCPAVGYRVDWHDEIILNGISGELVEDLNYQALGLAAIQILSDPNLRLFLRKNMEKIAHDIANPTKIAAEQKQIYEYILKSKS